MSRDAALRVALATANPYKARELAVLLHVPGVELLGPDDLPPHAPIEETGDTLEENALLKARAIRDLTGLVAVADDTGLFVDALGGRPGHLAARFAGENATYAENVAKLLASLRGVEPERRGATFRSIIALAHPGGAESCARGAVRGRILETTRGENGFGYDPVFLIEAVGRTFAEMSDEEKHVWSHRARAADGAREMLRAAVRSAVR
jgi:XTP/dITP diphosphohydrolase